MIIEIKKEEIEKLIIDYVESKTKGSVKVLSMETKEKGFYSHKVNYKNIETISVEVEV